MEKANKGDDANTRGEQQIIPPGNGQPEYKMKMGPGGDEDLHHCLEV